MKNKLLITADVIVTVCSVMYFSWREEWFGVGAFALMSIIFCGITYQLYRKYEENLSVISDNLECLLEKKSVLMPENDDTICSKINSQIQRIGEINIANMEQVERERDEMKQLIAEIAHQLRTPLANMETYIVLLREIKEDEVNRGNYLDAISQSEQKIAFLVEKFIVTARMEQRIIQIHKQKSDIKETIAEAVFQIHKKAEEKKIDIVIEEQENVERKVWHDKNWICESVYNLLENSIKYSPAGSTIKVFLKNNEMFTEISVKDEGIGIAFGEESKIFQLFYRGINASGIPGYGMGLYITREIIKKHDGFMRVKRKEHGMKISIFLSK